MSGRRASIQPPDLKSLGQVAHGSRLLLFISKKSATSRLAWLYLLQNKLNFDLINVDESGEHLRQLQLANPHETVPCLVDGDTVVYECPAIIQYLAEEYTDKQGMGSTLSEQIRAMSTMHWAHNTLQRCVITNYVYVMMKNSELSDPEAAMALTQTAKTDIRQHLQTLDTHYLGKSKFLFGNDCLFVDCFVAMLLTTLDLVSFDFKPFPRVKQWMTNVKQLYEDNWEEVCETHNMQVMQRGSRRASLM